ncbi:MAG: DinB family protein [Planctomycetes bacterium]|nr:DinB family protein [Planctomycetota bacterium]
MNAKDAIKYVLVSNQNILEMFLADLGDEDLLVRPVPGANHVAWQLGHLITSEVKLIADMGCATAKLPAGFAEKHTKLTAANDSPTAFLKKAEYMAVFKTVHEGTLAAL